MKESMWPLTFWAWLTSLNMMFSRSIHLPANSIFHSSLWLDNTPLCICIFLNPFFICRPSRLFFKAWLWWKVLQWTWGCKCGSIASSLTILWVRAQQWYLWPYDSSGFWGHSIAISLICIPTNSVEGLFFHADLPAFVMCVIDSHPDWSEVESQCDFWFAFPLQPRMLSISPCIYWPLYFWEQTIQLICPLDQ
jgi:hypothetical protein